MAKLGNGSLQQKNGWWYFVARNAEGKLKWQALTDAGADVQQIEESPLIPAYTKTHITWAKRERRFYQQIALCQVIDEIQKRGGNPFRKTARERQPFKLRPITRFERPHTPPPQQELLFK